MKTIKMLKDDRGADEGHTVAEYKKGEVYRVSDDLARCFESTKSAEETKDEPGDKSGDKVAAHPRAAKKAK